MAIGGPRGSLQRLARLLAVPTAGFVIVLAGCAMFQDHLLYFPTRAGLDSIEVEAKAAGARPWPNSGAAHRGFVVEPQDGPAVGTVVLFHGNAGYALHRRHWAEALGRLGWRTILAEYPGYGARSGAVGERSMVPDAIESLRLAHEQFGDPIVLAGESLGAGVAAAAAARTDVPLRGVLLMTPWADLPSLAQEKVPFLPVRLILRDRYDTIANLAAIDAPVAICIAEEDEVIPTHHSERLFEAIPEPKRCWWFPGRGHNDWPVGAHEPWWGEVMAYLSRSR
jgi:alpha-beta hydrolase superfamily lysophospholipase